MEGRMFHRKSQAEAFEALAAESEKSVYAVCCHMMGNSEDAMDCAQEAMLRAYRAFPSFRGDAKGSTWLIRIAMNVCLDEIRKRKKVVSLDEMREKTGFDPPDRKAAGPQEILEAKERKRLLTEAMKKLPEDARALIILRDMQQLSYDEIAQILSLPLGTVKSRLSRARDKLSEILQKSSELFSSHSV